MGCKVSFSCTLSLLAKVLCIIVLIAQSALLDYIIISLDKKASDAGRYIWIALDSLVVIFWLICLIFSHRFFQREDKIPVPNEGFTTKEIIKLAFRELPFAYVSWLLYAIVLVVKMNRMFWSFAETLRSIDESLFSNTSLKIILSMAGILFALLAYAHHNEVHNTKYRLLIEKLAAATSLDLLDAIMLLDILFVNVSKVEVTFAMDRAIRAFASMCFLLPVMPLLALRIISFSETAKSTKSFPLTMVLNSALYIVLVNIPLLCIRMVLWFHHDVDVTTFLTKNVMAITKGFMDIYKDLLVWREAQTKDSPDADEVQMEPIDNSCGRHTVTP